RRFPEGGPGGSKIATDTDNFKLESSFLWLGGIRKCAAREHLSYPRCAGINPVLFAKRQPRRIIMAMSTPRVLSVGESVLRSRWARADLWAFARAWGLLLVADLGLRALPFARVERWLSPKLSLRSEE